MSLTAYALGLRVLVEAYAPEVDHSLMVHCELERALLPLAIDGAAAAALMLSSAAMLEMLRCVGIRTIVTTERNAVDMEQSKQTKHRELCLTKELVIDEWGGLHMIDRAAREKERREKREKRAKEKREAQRAAMRKGGLQAKEEAKKSKVGYSKSGHSPLEARLVANEWIGSLVSNEGKQTSRAQGTGEDAPRNRNAPRDTPPPEPTHDAPRGGAA
jgi:hypothetical protein